MPRPGPVYDDAMKVLADDDLVALLGVVGVAGPARALTIELPGSARKADLVAETRDGLVHVEFVKDPAPDLDLRMVEYRVRLRRRDRTTPLRQFVLVLRDVEVAGSFSDPGPDPLTGSWTVVRLDRADPRFLLTAPTTAALAALVAGSEAERTAALVAAAAVISAQHDRDRRDVLLGAAATLASIVLPRDTIDRATKEATMPVPIRETPLGQEWLAEGRVEGEHTAVVRFTAALLRQRFGDDPRIPAVAETLAGLSDDERLDRIANAPDLDALT